MPRSRLAIVLAFIVLTVRTAHAIDDMDGHSLLELVEAIQHDDGTSGPMAALALRAYVQGFVAGQHRAWTDDLSLPRYCIPADASPDAAVNVVRRFVEHASVYGFSETAPQDFLNGEASIIVYLALALHYRCRD